MEELAKFRRLFDCHFTPLVKYCYYITKDKDQSKDIVQSFFVSILKDGKLSEIESFERFAYHSVKNRAINYLRDSKKFDRSQLPEIGEEPTIHLDPNFPRYLLEAAIRGLPDKCREVFMLSKFEGLTYEEIAGVQNLSVKTVEKHIGTGLQKLKLTLAPYKHLFLESNFEK